MDSSNKRKFELLGESFGTASGKLKKSILFSLVQKLGEDICFRCGNKIESIDDLSIEHKISWQLSENPRKAFYDLNNIAFSHLKCNIDATNKKIPHYNSRGEKSIHSKLKNDDVFEIRKELADGVPQRTIAKNHNVSQSIITDINTKKKWGHLR